MATYYARKAGNVNATDVWATTPTGTAGDFFPSFTNSDTLMANGFTVTLNVNTTVLEVRSDTTGGATSGGGFTLNNGVTLNANVYAGTTHCVTFSGTSPNSATINGNITGGTASSVVGAINNNTGTLNITGNLIGGSTTSASACYNNSTGIINITGNSTGGSAGNTYGAWNVNGTINIVGNITSGSGAGGAYNGSAGIVNITGNATASTTNIYAVYNTGAGTINITGLVTGGSGGTNGIGAYNNGAGTINIIGTAIGGSVGFGAQNNSTGNLIVTRAKGNGFGNGSSGLNSVVGVAGNQTGLTRVYEIEYGDLGQSPTSGPVFLFPASTNVALFYRSGTSKKTLVDASSSSGLLPNASDVRNGVTYNAGTYTGTMNVPGAASVASGVAVDNTTGTAILTTGNIADIWNYPVSGVSVSNSIGERLKNCSTVASMGQQLAAALSNIQ